MQTITPVHDDEKLIARGTYTYLLNGNAAGVVEPWTIHEHNGTIITRVMRDAQQFGSQILVESRADDAAITEFEVRWTHSGEGMVSRAEASYRIVGDEVTVQRRIEESEQIEEVVATNADLVVSPLMRVYLGEVIQQVAEQGQGDDVIVLVPSIVDPTDGDNLLSVILDPRRAKCLHDETIEVAGRSFEAQVYEYVGGNYTPDSRFWIDDHAMLLRYTWKQSDDAVWDIRLTEYQR